jgi:HEAT repeat protein
MQPLNDVRATAMIEQGFHDKEWVVRFAAVMAAGKRQAGEFTPVLQRMAASDPNDSVRVAAIYALRQVGDTANMNTLADTLHSPDPAVRANTAMVLGMMGDPSAIPLLLAQRQETDSRVKFELIAALARLGDVAAQRNIAVMALSKFAEDQWDALVVCGDLPPAIVGHALQIGLSAPLKIQNGTPAEDVRRQLLAARSLAEVGSMQGAEVALAHLNDPAPESRALAALALGEILSPEGATRIEPLLNDTDPAVRRAAAAAIIDIFARDERNRS